MVGLWLRIQLTDVQVNVFASTYSSVGCYAFRVVTLERI